MADKTNERLQLLEAENSSLRKEVEELKALLSQAETRMEAIEKSMKPSPLPAFSLPAKAKKAVEAKAEPAKGAIFASPKDLTLAVTPVEGKKAADILKAMESIQHPSLSWFKDHTINADQSVKIRCTIDTAKVDVSWMKAQAKFHSDVVADVIIS